MHCKHCGEELNRDENDGFCCLGCNTAHSIINALNLGKYYEYCQTIYFKMPMKVHKVINELNYIDYINKTPQGYRISLIVEGIHCGSCVWLIENTLRQQRDVLSVQLNLSTKRLVIEWRNQDERYINDLVNITEKLGYKLIPFTPDASIAENQRNEHELLKCLIIAGFGSVSIMMITFGIWVANNNQEMTPYLRDMLHWVATLITVPAIFYAGRPFFRSALAALKARHSNMDVPISIATILAVAISMQELLRSSHYIYLDAAISLVFFLLIGRYLDLKVRNKARQAAQNLVLSQAQSITLFNDGALKLTGIKNAEAGDIAFVAAGGKIPVDGIVISGESEVDSSLITGETLPVRVREGGFVNAGTINLLNPLKIKITRLGENTTLSEIIRLMENAEQGKARFVQLADRIASYYTPVVISLSLLTLIGWLLMGARTADAVLYAISVLIITCPCALGLAVPIVQVIATSRLLSQGILVKSADALERLAQCQSFIFDKTGTLTEGMPKFVKSSDFPQDQLEAIASLAGQSRHPLCEAITRAYTGKLISVKVSEKKGFGVEASIAGVNCKLGNQVFCNVKNTIDDGFSEAWFKADGKKAVRLKFSDTVKADARQLMTWLKEKGFNTGIISGDRSKAVAIVAEQIGLPVYHAESMPQDKYEFIETLQKQGVKTVMIGDGLNDAAALKLAHVSMSPASALDIAQTSADIVFQGKKLWPVREAFEVAVSSVKLVKQNFAISIAYNLVTIPFAMFGFATPVMAAIIMSASSIMVVLNAMRLMLPKPAKVG